MTGPNIKCYGGKHNRDRTKPKPSSSAEQQPKLPLYVESFHEERTDNRERYERVKEMAPVGFHELLQKITRAVIVSRPVHLYRFIADYLDVELAQRAFDDIMYGCSLRKSKKLEPYPTASCEIICDLIHLTKPEIYGEAQFTMGPIPEYEIKAPALDRYRDYAALDVFDMTCCDVEPRPDPLIPWTTEPPVYNICGEPEAEVPAEVPVDEPPPVEEPPKQPSEPVTQSFEMGPVPDYELQEPALDRYREYAGIETFDISGLDECDLTAACKCTFCMMKEARSRPQSCMDPEERKKPCATRRKPQEDPFKVFIDSPVYRHPKVRDEDAQGEQIICEPFGDFFKQDQHFEETVFEPEYPFGSASFTREHPLFGDFRVRTKDKTDVIDDVDHLMESPEFEDIDHMNDPTDGDDDEEEEAAQPAAESAAEPAGEPAAEAEAAPEAAPEAETAPEAEPGAAPEAEPEAAPEAEPEAAPVAEPEPEPEPEAPPEPGPEAAPEAEPEAEPAPAAEEPPAEEAAETAEGGGDEAGEAAEPTTEEAAAEENPEPEAA